MQEIKNAYNACADRMRLIERHLIDRDHEAASEAIAGLLTDSAALYAANRAKIVQPELFFVSLDG